MRNEINAETIELVRNDLLSGIAKRADFERALDAGNESIQNTLQTFRRNVERADAFTMGGAQALGMGGDFLMSQIVRDACRNVYSLSKCLVLCRVWQGSAFGTRGDDATTFATIIAIAEGREGKALSNRVDQICSALGMGKMPGVYTSGSTQSGSSVAALQALNVLETKHGGRNVKNPDAWGILLKAAKATLKRALPDMPFTPAKG